MFLLLFQSNQTHNRGFVRTSINFFILLNIEKFARLLPPLDVIAIFKALSPESNPNSLFSSWSR